MHACLDEVVAGFAATPAPGTSALATMNDHDAVKLHGRTAANSRSREVLEVLPGGNANGKTPAELGAAMKPDAAGAKLSPGSVRAAMRVVQRVTTTLIGQGVISKPVLQIDFSGYKIEGCGRYYLDEEAREALDAHLAP